MKAYTDTPNIAGIPLSKPNVSIIIIIKTVQTTSPKVFFVLNIKKEKESVDV
jgi:hypothetical protein